MAVKDLMASEQLPVSQTAPDSCQYPRQPQMCGWTEFHSRTGCFASLLALFSYPGGSNLQKVLNKESRERSTFKTLSSK